MTTTPHNRTRASNIPALERASEKSWEAWLVLFESNGAAKLSHTQIAALAEEQMPGTLENGRWWAQVAAIAFEQHAGLRVPGQLSTGEFRVGASRTVPMGRDEALAAWIERFGSDETHLGYAVSNRRNSVTEKRSFYRFSLDGAGKVEIAAALKDDSKSILSITHEGLPSGEQIEEWRAYWKAQLTRL